MIPFIGRQFSTVTPSYSIGDDDWSPLSSSWISCERYSDRKFKGFRKFIYLYPHRIIITLWLLFFRLSGIVVGVFYLCWIPFMVAVILSAFVKNLITPVVVLVISVLIYSNSAINPVLYGYLNRDFRLAYKRMFSRISLPSACARVHPRERRRCYELPELSTSSQPGQGLYISDSALWSLRTRRQSETEKTLERPWNEFKVLCDIFRVPKKLGSRYDSLTVHEDCH